MKKPGKRKINPENDARIRPDHALVGTWEDPDQAVWVPVHYNHPLAATWQEVENPVLESSAFLTIAVVAGRFVVTMEEEDGTKFKISNVRWDGSALSFVSVYPPTGHLVKHVLRPFKRGLIEHEITYTDRELWRKLPSQKRRT
jgi:hypothetical protein